MAQSRPASLVDGSMAWPFLGKNYIHGASGPLTYLDASAKSQEHPCHHSARESISAPNARDRLSKMT